jgi:hypothetical protein
LYILATINCLISYIFFLCFFVSSLCFLPSVFFPLFSSLYPNRRWLQQQKLTFIEGCERIENTPQCFLQHCILPRALFSPEDAYFCAMFTAILNELQVCHSVALFVVVVVVVCSLLAAQ